MSDWVEKVCFVVGRICPGFIRRHQYLLSVGLKHSTVFDYGIIYQLTLKIYSQPTLLNINLRTTCCSLWYKLLKYIVWQFYCYCPVVTARALRFICFFFSMLYLISILLKVASIDGLLPNLAAFHCIFYVIFVVFSYLVNKSLCLRCRWRIVVLQLPFCRCSTLFQTATAVQNGQKLVEFCPPAKFRERITEISLESFPLWEGPRLMVYLRRIVHCVSKKRAPFYFYDNFVRCWPIFIILSLADSSGNLQ